MKKLYLFCDAGMSTSLMAQKMQKVADQNKLDLDIKAFSTKAATEKLEEGIDMLLLGPQVRHLKDRMEELAEPYDIPVVVVDSEDYGMMNGERALKKALIALKKYKNK